VSSEGGRGGWERAGLIGQAFVHQNRLLGFHFLFTNDAKKNQIRFFHLLLFGHKALLNRSNTGNNRRKKSVLLFVNAIEQSRGILDFFLSSD
jgi:hypothetical protein